jgi:hypothetical protein
MKENKVQREEIVRALSPLVSMASDLLESDVTLVNILFSPLPDLLVANFPRYQIYTCLLILSVFFCFECADVEKSQARLHDTQSHLL